MDYRKVVNTLRNLTDDLDGILIINHRKVVLKWKKKKVSDESIVEEAKGEIRRNNVAEEDGTEAKETKTKTKRKKVCSRS